MLISDRYHFIFIHVYKNAGTSITAALTPYTSTPLQRIARAAMRRLGFPLGDAKPYPDHISASELAAILGMERFESYFSFGFVRNPWDLQVSLYNFMVKTPTHFQHGFIQGLGSFEAYIHWRCAEEVRFQKDFLFLPDGKQLVDFIGRYERLEEDFQAICRRIGISATLPRLNVSKTRSYQSYYSSETMELVRRSFAPDIELFSYEFG